MHDFLDTPAFSNPKPAVRISRQDLTLDPDLNPNWMISAATHFKRRGLTLRQAAFQISQDYPEFKSLDWTELRKVLTGKRVSARLLTAISALPPRKEAA